jgi:two-component system chemotaxis response regulator CheB
LTAVKDGQYKAVVIGASAGGLSALSEIVASLRADFPVPVLIVQHRAPQGDDLLSELLDEKSQIRVKEAEEKERLAAGVVYIAPANYHLLVEQDETLSFSAEEKVNFARPAIDVLFETAADAYGRGLIGIILTGAGSDGSKGLKKIGESGGLTIVLDPAFALADAMPRAAIAVSDVKHILPLAEIGPFLNRITSG